MRRSLRRFVFVAAALVPEVLFAQALQPVSVALTASVEAIDAPNRAVTLRSPTGELIVLPVGPEVANFEQIRVGDRVAVRYYAALTLELKKHGMAARERTERVLIEAAPAGERPAGRSTSEVRVIADVIAVDARTRTVTLRGPTRVVNLAVRDLAQFAPVEVGDQVEAVYIEAAAVSVEAAK